MRIILFLLLILPLSFDVDYVGRVGITDAAAAEQEEFDVDDVGRVGITDAAAAEQEEPDKKKDKRSETRKRVEKETAAWVEKIQEEDRKRREAED
ncbi:MAG: hypothetical protein O7H40_17835 [Gammaproteobacteria bacterium]|nr:hypothetical protein [Gammaproteobacteria bacterium]